MNLQQKATLHNRFDFEIYDTKTGKTEYAQAENIVLDNMWTCLCNSYSYFSYIGVGTGTGALSPTRTTLFNHRAYKSAVAVETVYDTDTAAHVTKSVTFSETEANGAWTEVGILYSTSTGSSYVTHALITDSEGNSITVDKTNTKIITIYATIFAEVLTPTSGMGSGGSKNDILRYLVSSSGVEGASFWPSVFKTTSGLPSRLGALGKIKPTWIADTANKRSYTNLLRFGAAAANGDIRSIGLARVNSLEETLVGGIEIPDGILFAKHDFTGVALGTGDGLTTEFDFPKDLIKPESEVIYIEGVAKTRGTDYTIHYGVRSTVSLLASTTPTELYPETIVLPQPDGAFFTDGAAIISSIEIKNASMGYKGTYNIELSEDGATWVTAGSGSLNYNGHTVTLSDFTAAKYKYLRWSGTLPYLATFKIYCTPPAVQKQIKFATPPANGAVITADFSTEYIPKSENFVLDLQAEVVYGEGA